MEQQLDQYQQQLEQVESVLSQLNPGTNDYETYHKLSQDIQNAIKLTQQLIQLHSTTTSEEEHFTASPPTTTPTTPKFQQGDYVYGLYEGLWYVAKVNQVILPTTAPPTLSPTLSSSSQQHSFPPLPQDTSDNVSYHVTYVGYGNSDVLQPEKWNIKKYEHVPLEYLHPGARVYAVHNLDQNFYEAVIESVSTENESCWVSFRSSQQQLGTQEVPFPLIRLRAHEHVYQPKYSSKQHAYKTKRKPGQDTDSKTTSAVGGGSGDAITGQKRKEPEGSDAQQQEQPPQKKKKRGPRKPSKADEELQKRSSSWQSFMNKDKKGVKRESMFKSPSSLQGKVGVSGSDNAMTQSHQFKPLAKSTTHKSNQK